MKHPLLNGVTELWVLMILFVAMIQDISTGRISNRLVIVGGLVGLIYRIYLSGVWGIFDGMVRMLIPILLLFLFYLKSALGAGDLKLISVISCYMEWNELTRWLSFLVPCVVICAMICLVRKKKMLPLGVPLFFSMAVMTVFA